MGKSGRHSRHSRGDRWLTAAMTMTALSVLVGPLLPPLGWPVLGRPADGLWLRPVVVCAWGLVGVALCIVAIVLFGPTRGWWRHVVACLLVAATLWNMLMIAAPVGIFMGLDQD
jgi:hypothetical protein